MAPRLGDGLALHGWEVDTGVFAVPGARSSGLAAQVEAALRWQPLLAVIVIGANDLTHLEPIEPAVQSLADAVRRLRDADTEVVVAPAPDLSSVPHVPLFLRDVVTQSSSRAGRSIAGWRTCDGPRR